MNRFVRFETAFVGLLVLAGLAVAQAKEEKKTPARHQGAGRVYDKDAGFSFEPPKGWEKVANAQNMIFNFKQPVKVGEAEVGNVNVVSAADEVTPEKLAEQLKDYYPKQFKNWKLTDDTMTTVDGKKTYQIAGRHTVSDASGKKFDASVLQYYSFSPNKKVYIVTFTTREDVFPKLRKTLEQSALSSQMD